MPTLSESSCPDWCVDHQEATQLDPASHWGVESVPTTGIWGSVTIHPRISTDGDRAGIDVLTFQDGQSDDAFGDLSPAEARRVGRALISAADRLDQFVHKVANRSVCPDWCRAHSDPESALHATEIATVEALDADVTVLQTFDPSSDPEPLIELHVGHTVLFTRAQAGQLRDALNGLLDG